MHFLLYNFYINLFTKLEIFLSWLTKQTDLSYLKLMAWSKMSSALFWPRSLEGFMDWWDNDQNKHVTKKKSINIPLSQSKVSKVSLD